MATSTLIPLSEYLATTYRPDRDYIDGELKERNRSERPHAALQALFSGIFLQHQEDWGVIPLTEQRVQTSLSHYRIADVCVVRESDPQDAIVQQPPLLCIEILSKDDTLRELQQRVDDYFAMGVENVWAVDPWTQRGYIATASSFVQPQDGMLSIENTAIRISLAELFTRLSKLAKLD